MSDQAAVVDQMLAQGLEMPELPLRVGTPRPVRYGAKKRLWYWLQEMRLDNGQIILAGKFGDWSQGSHRIEIDWKGIGDAEREQLRVQREAQRAADVVREQRKHARAALSARERWARGLRVGASSYLTRKAVAPEACRFEEDGSLLLPLLRYDLPRESALVGLQVIGPDGVKRFTTGLAKRGAALRLGLVEEGAPIMVCEGYATGLTLREATGRRIAVFVALDAGNLQHVVGVLRLIHPSSQLLLCADDDYCTDGNPGRAAAKAIVKAQVSCHLIYPVFPRGVVRGVKDTDFNDLHKLCGLNVVARQLRAPLAYLTARSEALRHVA